MASRACAAVLGSFVLAGAGLAGEGPETMADPLDGVGPILAGFWQGNWQLWREDLRLTTRGAAVLLRLHVLHDEGADRAELQWIADRGICPDPSAPPCEWVGAAGVTEARVSTGGLEARLAISADAEEVFELRLEPEGRGRLGSPVRGWHYPLRAERGPE